MHARFARWWFWFVLALALALPATTSRWKAVLFDRITTLQSGTTPDGGPGAGRNRIVPMLAFDSLYWINYAQELAATDRWRIRETRIDNAPLGREVHWSSGFAWWLVGVGRVRGLATGEPVAQAIEYGAAYANPLLGLLATAAFAFAVARRFGPAAGGVIALALAGSTEFTVGFGVNEPDHHGLINVAALGTVLCLVLGGAGWERRGAAGAAGLLPAAGGGRRWFIASALCGALGMWVSAASQIQVFAGVALAAGLAAFATGREKFDDAFVARPELWRTWGRWGGATALGFYLLEYFPAHLGMRLEVNHPLYAAALWGAGELLAALAENRQNGAPAWPEAPLALARRLAAVGAVALAPLALVGGGAQWFAPLDPFLRGLPALVAEGAPLLAQLKKLGFVACLPDFAPPALALALGLAAAGAPRLSRPERALAAWTAVACAPLLALSLAQGRWFLVAAAVAAGAVVPAVAVFGARLKPAAAGVALAALTGIFLGPFAVRETLTAWREVHADLRGLAYPLRQMLAMRHIAQDLRAQVGHTTDAVVLAGPDESALLAYYGRFRTVGTFYWENLQGLKTAAAIYTAQDLETARRRIAGAGITHLLSYPMGSFGRAFATLSYGEAGDRLARTSFAALLYADGKFPVWLRPVSLRLPEALAMGNAGAIFEFAPQQTDADQFYYIARHLLVAGQAAKAVTILNDLERQVIHGEAVPQLLAEALLATGDTAGAEAAFDRAADQARAAGRLAPYREWGQQLETRADFERALRRYFQAVGFTPDDGAAHRRLAWIMATCPDERGRNGALALAHARRALALAPGGAGTATLAATLAETGDYPGAVETAAVALRLAQEEKLGVLAAEITAQLGAYRARRPWRDRPAPPPPGSAPAQTK